MYTHPIMSGTMIRPSVPVDRELVTEVREHPERFALSAETSTSGRLAALIEAGAATLRSLQVENERLATYAEWAQDAERLEALAEMRASARGDGGFLGRFANLGEAEEQGIA
jgi:hypothetical protein